MCFITTMTELANGCLVIDVNGGSLRKRSDDIQYRKSSGEEYRYDIEDIESIEIKTNIMISVPVIEECMARDIDIIFTFIDKSYAIYPKQH